MVSQISNTTVQNMPAYNYANNGMIMPMNMGMNMQNPGLFGNMGMMGTNDYSNDIIAPDFMKQNYYPQFNTQTQNAHPSQQGQEQPNSVFSQNQNQPQVQNTQQTFTGNENGNEINQRANELYNSLNQNTENNAEKKTTSVKTATTILGALTPVATGLYSIAKGAKFSDIFKLKELGIKIPAFALAGWCVGVIVDGILNSPKAQNAQTQVQA